MGNISLTPCQVLGLRDLKAEALGIPNTFRGGIVGMHVRDDTRRKGRRHRCSVHINSALWLRAARNARGGVHGNLVRPWGWWAAQVRGCPFSLSSNVRHASSCTLICAWNCSRSRATADCKAAESS
eukprot:EG_transcript_20837